MGKHHGSEGRKSIKIAPKKCRMQLLKLIEKDDFSHFFLLLLLLFLLLLLQLFPPPAAAASAPAAPSVQMAANG